MTENPRRAPVAPPKLESRPPQAEGEPRHGRERETPDNVHTRALATFAADLSAERVPGDVLDHALWDIIDTIGCAVFGTGLPIAKVLRTTYEGIAGGQVPIWGDRWSASPETAALVNGTLAHSFELDDLHARGILHPGGTTLPALAAVGATRSVSGRSLLVAHVAGLEVACRVGLAIGVPLLRRGWHNNGVLGVFGASAGASNLLRLDHSRALNALGIAGSLAAGLMAAQYGAMVKRMHAGQAAQNGLRAALLAENGFTGIATVFEEPYGGYLTTYADASDPSELSAGLGDRWETLNVGFKPYAACGSSHTTIDVLREMRRDAGVSAEIVQSIRVSASSATRDHVGWPYVPDTTTTAQMNLPYAAAVTLLDGDAFVEQFADGRLRDPRVIDLAGRVQVVSDPSIDAKGPGHRHEVDIEVTLVDGRVVRGHRTSASGSARHPLSRDDLAKKFLTLVGMRLGGKRANEILQAMTALPDAPDAGRVFEDQLGLSGKG
jgi:2-methylcitrate dehydratase PrpD